MPARGQKLSAEARAKISIACKGKPLSANHRAAIGRGHRPPTVVWFQRGDGRWCVMCRRGYELWYRVVMRDLLGRALRSGEVVHHRNGDCTDDRPENLELLDPSTHAREHPRPFTDEHRRRAGEAVRAQKRALTHCSKGHLYTPENTRIDKHGKRNCRACKREWQRHRRAEASGAGLRRAA